MDKYTVFIVDNEEKQVNAIKTRINNSSTYKYVGTAETDDDAFRKIKVLGGVDILIS